MEFTLFYVFVVKFITSLCKISAYTILFTFILFKSFLIIFMTNLLFYMTKLACFMKTFLIKLMISPIPCIRAYFSDEKKETTINKIRSIDLLCQEFLVVINWALYWLSYRDCLERLVWKVVEYFLCLKAAELSKFILWWIE